MLIQHIIVEASVTYCEASKFPCVTVRVSATLDSGGNQTKLQEFLIEETSVSAQITDQIADFGSDIRILMSDQNLQVVVNIGIMNWLIEILVDSC